MIAGHIYFDRVRTPMNQNFVQNASWWRHNAPVASGLRTSVRLEPVANNTEKPAEGDGVVFVPAHRTQREGISLDVGEYDLLFEDGRPARATVTRAYTQGGFFVAFFTVALGH